MTLRFTFTAICVWTWLFEPTVAGAIATWTTGLGAPQVMMQNDTTGSIYYSLCNSNGTTPIFPANETASFSLDSTPNLAPKNGTSLAGVGYEEDGANIAAIWYENEQNNIVHALFRCDHSTGHFNPYASENQWIVSTGQSVKPNTGLAAVNLGSVAGYRVYFHDETNATSILRYSNGDSWAVVGNVSQDAVQTNAISTGFTDGNKISVAFGRGPSNIEVASLQPDGSWEVTLFPTPFDPVDTGSGNTTTLGPTTNNTSREDFILSNATAEWSLDGWDGSAQGIGLTLNDDGSRNIFYIGNDSALHQVYEADDRWQASPDQDVQAWPLADSPSAQFATTFNFNRNQAWIYYMSDGRLNQAYQSSKNRWEAATALPTFNDTVIESNDNNGLSTGAKAGIGVGVGLGVLALLAVAIFFFLRRKRQSEGEKKRVEAEAEATTAAASNQPPSSFAGSPAPTYSSGVPQGQWVDGQWIQAQTQSKPDGQWQERYSYIPVPGQQPVYHEMPNEERALHEMPGNAARREVPTHELESRT